MSNSPCYTNIDSFQASSASVNNLGVDRGLRPFPCQSASCSTVISGKLMAHTVWSRPTSIFIPPQPPSWRRDAEGSDWSVIQLRTPLKNPPTQMRRRLLDDGSGRAFPSVSGMHSAFQVPHASVTDAAFLQRERNTCRIRTCQHMGGYRGAGPEA